jgi:hypothetical protein
MVHKSASGHVGFIYYGDRSMEYPGDARRLRVKMAKEVEAAKKRLAEEADAAKKRLAEEADAAKKKLAEEARVIKEILTAVDKYDN